MSDENTLTKYQLMALCLSDPDTIKNIAITNSQRNLFNFVERLGSSGCKARDASNAFSISIQSASGRLIKLFRMGYLLRRSIEQCSGGFEWEYYADPNINEAKKLSEVAE